MIRVFFLLMVFTVLSACEPSHNNSQADSLPSTICSSSMKSAELVIASKFDVAESGEISSLAGVVATRELTVLIKSNCQARGVVSAGFDAGESLNPSGAMSYHLSLPKETDLGQFRQSVLDDACVLHVSQSHLSQSDGTFEPVGLTDPLEASQNHLKMIHADAGYEAIASAVANAKTVLRPVVIAVIDTGIDM